MNSNNNIGQNKYLEKIYKSMEGKNEFEKKIQMKHELQIIEEQFQKLMSQKQAIMTYMDELEENNQQKDESNSKFNKLQNPRIDNQKQNIIQKGDNDFIKIHDQQVPNGQIYSQSSETSIYENKMSQQNMIINISQQLNQNTQQSSNKQKNIDSENTQPNVQECEFQNIEQPQNQHENNFEDQNYSIQNNRFRNNIIESEEVNNNINYNNSIDLEQNEDEQLENTQYSDDNQYLEEINEDQLYFDQQQYNEDENLQYYNENSNDTQEENKNKSINNQKVTKSKQQILQEKNFKRQLKELDNIDQKSDEDIIILASMYGLKLGKTNLKQTKMALNDILYFYLNNKMPKYLLKNYTKEFGESIQIHKI